MDLLNKFMGFIKDEQLFQEGESILLGVSGGPDSLTMLDLFSRVKDRFNLDLIIFHLNHMFRKEAQGEADFVAKIAAQHHLKAIIESYNVPKYIQETGLSPEEAARKIRFDLMLKRVEDLNIDKIALAHNRDDLVETIFLHLFRGTGLKGLSGINPITKIGRVEVIHPLLSIYRRDIEYYCQVRALNPKYDSTNQETIYMRNKIRHEIIPYVEKEINPQLKEVMAQMAKIIKEEDEFLTKLAQKSLEKVLIERDEDQIILSLVNLQNSTKVIRRRLMQIVIFKLKGNNVNLYSNHYEAIDKLIISGSTGKMITLPDNIKVKRLYERLIFKRGDFNKQSGEFYFKLKVPGDVILSDGKKLRAETSTCFSNWRSLAEGPKMCICDANKVKLPLIVRNRRPGDRFHPLGMKGMKKLKDFFIDEKIPQEKRDQIPVVVDSSQKVIWVGGLRMDDRFKVSGETKKIIILCITEMKGD